MVIQINGKLRSQIEIDADTDDETVKSAALSDSKIQSHLEGKQIVKIVIVKNKLVSLVVR